MLWNALLCTAQHGLLLTKCMCLSHCSNILCLDSVHLLFCALKLHLLIDVRKTTHGDPWSSLLLPACWGLVADFEEHLTLLMEIAISPVLVHLLRLSEGNPAVTELNKISCYWLWYRAMATDKRGLTCFIGQVSICCIIRDTCISVSSAVLTDKNLVSGWTEQSLKKFQSFCNVQATQSREKTRRPISEKLKLGMKAPPSKADSLWGATKRLQEPSLSLKKLGYSL